MARKQKEVEDALFQIKSLEESLQKNAQGILSSTMKEEIRSLVKESLKEQDEVEDEDVEDEMDTDVEMDLDTDNEDEMDYEEEDTLDVDDEDMTDDMSMDSDDDTIDMTGASDAEVLRVFRAMSDNDGVVVKRDDNMIHLSDNENDTEYIIQLSESMMDDSELKEFGKSEFDLYDFHHSGDKDEDEFDFSFEDDEEDFEGQNDILNYEDRAMNRYFSKDRDDDDSFEDEHDYDDELWSDEDDFSELDEEEMVTDDSGKQFPAETTENIYELEIDDDMMDFGGDEEEITFLDEDDLENEGWMHESKKEFKAKGVGMGSASKYKMSKKPNMDGGFKTVKKNANKTMGTGKAKFEYKEEVNNVGVDKKPMKKMETKEAARTRGNGSFFRKGGLPKQKAHSKANTAIKESSEELNLLRAKNEEYRKALDLFRTKLNEVAVFNSNLAYATRLFTEHSTTKQEKINILKRFDDVETLKESKNLYKSIKNELGDEKVGETTITESIQRTVSRTPETGSAVNLIESKTYENPQFLRMKDLMGKIK